MLLILILFYTIKKSFLLFLMKSTVMSKPGKLFLIFLLFLLSGISGFTQGNMHLKNGVTKVKVPFEYHQRIIIIPIKINNVSLNFILDTGASKTVIFSLNDIEEINFYNTEHFTVRGIGSGEPLEAILSKNNNLNLANTIFSNDLDIYIVSEYKIDLSAKLGKTIHGIIGYDLLKDFIVKFNYSTKTITFYDHEHFKPPNKRRYELFDLEINKKKPYITGTIVDKTLGVKEVKLLIDSGNSDAFWLFDDPSAGFLAPEPHFTDHLGVGLSGNISGKRSVINSFKLGKYTLKKPTVAFLDSTQTHFASHFKSRNGSLGNKVLERFHAYYDLSNRKLWLKKTRHLKSRFQYNKAGIEIAYAGKTLVKKRVFSSNNNPIADTSNGDRIVLNESYEFAFKPVFNIFKIRDNSPAKTAGVQEGDILHKINGKSVTGMTLEDILHYFYRDHGRQINLEVYRNGVRHKFSFKLKDPFTQS